MNLGNLLAQEGRLPEAAARLAEAAAVDPYDWQIQYNLGVVLERTGDVAGAAKAYVEAKKWAEDDAVAQRIDVLLRNALAKLAGNLAQPQ